MGCRLQKQTWVELRRLFVTGWSHGKLAKRFAVLIGMGIATAQTSAQSEENLCLVPNPSKPVFTAT